MSESPKMDKDTDLTPAGEGRPPAEERALTPDREQRVRTLTERALGTYNDTVSKHQGLTRSTWQEVIELISTMSEVEESRSAINNARMKLCLVYGKYRIKARDYVTYLHANYTVDSIRLIDSFKHEDDLCDSMVKDILSQLDDRIDTLAERSTHSSQSSRLSSHRSNKSETGSEAVRARAKAERAKAARAFSHKEAVIRKKQAQLEEEEALAQARTHRIKQELEVDLNLVKNEKVCAEAEAEAEVYEGLSGSGGSNASESIGISLPRQVENAYERTKTYIEAHQSTEGTAAVLKATAPPFVPHIPTSMPPEHPAMISHGTSYTMKDEVVPSLVNFLMRKELASSRLTTFNDNPDSYLCWKSTFQSVVREASVTPSEELDLLVKWLGPVSSMYASSIRSSNGSDPALGRKLLWERLDERYGSPEAVEAALQKKLDNFPKPIDKSRMYELADVLTEILVLKDNPKYHQILSHYDSPMGVRQVLVKLPTRVQLKWNDRAFSYKNTKKVAFPPFSYFVSFMKDMSRLMNDPGLMVHLSDNAEVQDSGPRRSRNDRGPGVRVKKTELQTDSVQTLGRWCPIHPESRTHSLSDCREFHKKPLAERKQFLKDNSICYKCCASDKHMRKDCDAQVRCSECGSSRHVTALHQPRNNTERGEKRDISDHKGKVSHGGESSNDVNNKCTSVCGKGFQGRSCAKVVLVNVSMGKESEKPISVYALLDDQSNRSLASTELLDTLGVTGAEIDYTLSSCSGNLKCTGRKAEGVVVQSSDRSDSFCLPPLIECSSIPSDDSEIPTPEVVRQFQHLSSIVSCIPEYRPDCSIGLLIGRDVPEVHHIQQQITGPRGSPFAQRTRLGWVVVGDVCLNKVHPPGGEVNISTLKTNIVNGRGSIFTPCKQSLCLTEEIRYDPLFNKTKDDEKTAWSVEDREFMDLMNRECVQDKNGFWTAPLPFRNARPRMPNNRSLAMKRAMILDRSLRRDDLKRKHFTSFMQRVIDSGAAEVAPPPQGEVWYLPIFGVYNSKKPGKIRGVFDSSADFKGTSLNKTMLSGPNLTNSLLAILLRFRKDKYAVSADIEQMFYRFLVKDEHRNFLRFLWYRNNDPELDLIEYRMCAHVFGNSPSPAIATYALRKAVEKEDEDIRNFVTNDFYVDDALTSGADPKELSALMLRTQTALLQNGNIRLHKIMSNSIEVVQSFPSNDLGEGLKSLDIQTDGLSTQGSSLGVGWNLASDTFQFNVELTEGCGTRREMLSALNSIFDPMGFLSPFTIQGRILLRELTSGEDWDSALPVEYQTKWSKWKQSLKRLKDIQIPRMLTPVSVSTAKDVQLHVYCDASELAVAAVSYIQIQNEGKVHTGFVMGKAKLAPSKGHTIPRLELCAAVLAVQVGEVVCETLEIQDVRYHSDSRVVLGYINNTSRRFYTYVANRIERILRSSNPSQWSYVNTNDNPADQATRASGKHLLDFEHSMWLCGPKQLQRKHEEASNELVYELIEPKGDKEIRPEVSVMSRKTVTQETLCSEFERFSSWKRLISFVCLIKRAVHRFRLRKWVKTGKDEQTQLSPTREESEYVVIRQVQKSVFSEEIWCLDNAKPISKSSFIKNLDPYLDAERLLRVGGRLKSSTLPIQETNPIILPRKHHVSRLMVRHHHERACHQGRLITEGSLRNNGYWIVGAKRLVSSVIRDCVPCKRLRGKLEHQKMADLPKDRVTPGPPFSSVGIDAFGPWSVISRKTRGGFANSKRWAILFTCMTTRAIHIEVIEDMSSSSFINALRRFVALRGNVKEIRSDCGTNFVGAVNELKLDAINVSDGQVAKCLNDSGIVWKFNAPHSSHMGGVWERMIGVVRRILDSMLMGAAAKNLTHEVLTTFMAEVCAIVNSRPVASISNDPYSPEILSPAILLNQKMRYCDPVSTLSFSEKDLYKAQWKRVQILSQMFWKKWREGYLQTLQARRKWMDDKREVEEGDVILLRDKLLPRNDWALGVVQQVFRSDCDNKVRKVEVRIANDGNVTTYIRPVTEMVVLLEN